MLNYKEKEKMILEAIETYKNMCKSRENTIKAIKTVNSEAKPILNIELLLANHIKIISEM